MPTPGKLDQLSWSNTLKLLLFLLVAASIIWALFNYGGTYSVYVLVFALGGLLGGTEVLGRYTDSPMAALKSPGAAVYVLVNSFASVLALYLILKLAPEIQNPIYQVLLAGLGAMAFLRSSLFKAKVADQDVAVGPAIILDTLLKFADAQVDRGRAVDRASRIATVIGSLQIAQANADLPQLCFALMQNLPIDTRQRVLDDITLVATDPKRSEQVKIMQIGLVLWNRVGIGTLTGAVALLKNLSAAGTIAAAEAGGKSILPAPPQGKPEDLMAEIQKQLAKDQAIAAQTEPKQSGAPATKPSADTEVKPPPPPEEVKPSDATEPKQSGAPTAKPSATTEVTPTPEIGDGDAHPSDVHASPR
jgi:hypothetical protein